jgi:hypothetical protein
MFQGQRLRALFGRGQSGNAPNVGPRASSVADLLRRPPEPLINPLEGFGVLWSAKSGSKAAKFWYFARIGLLGEAADFPEPGRPRPHQFQNEVVNNRTFYREWLESTDPTQLAWLRVIRDPYNRAISSYRHALRHGYENSRIKHCLGLKITERGLSFVEFLDYLLAIDITDCNLHHSQQWHPIEQHVTLRKVVNLDKEQLLDALEAFEEALGLPQLDPDIRERMLEEWGRDSKRYHKRLDAETGSSANVIFTPDEAGGAWPSYEAFLSHDTRRKIEQIYAKDFAAYADFL